MQVRKLKNSDFGFVRKPIIHSMGWARCVAYLMATAKACVAAGNGFVEEDLKKK